MTTAEKRCQDDPERLRRQELGDRIIRRYLHGSSFYAQTIHDTAAQLERFHGGATWPSMLRAIGISQDRPYGRRIHGQFRIRPPDQPDLPGTWDNHRVLQALMVGYSSAKSGRSRRLVVRDVYAYLGVAQMVELGTWRRWVRVGAAVLAACIFTGLTAGLALVVADLGMGVVERAAPTIGRNRTAVAEQAPTVQRAQRAPVAQSASLAARPLPPPDPVVLQACRKREASRPAACQMDAEDTVAAVARFWAAGRAPLQFAMQIATANRIRVPEWGLAEGTRDARRLSPGFILKLPAD